MIDPFFAAMLEPLDHALGYAQRGWAVFPCHWIVATQVDGGERLTCSCGNPKCKSPGKHPLTKRGFKDASKDADQITAWWQSHPEANIGIATGKISGIWVLDYDNDTEHVGAETYQVDTPRPGRHYYYLYSDRIKAQSGGGIDCKTDGGYVLAPPSVHLLGNYRLVNETDPIETPEEIIERFGSKPKKELSLTPAITRDNLNDIISRAIAYLQKIEPGVQGAGGSTPMFRAAGALIHGFALDQETAFKLLKEVYSPRCDPPWDDDREIWHKIKSVQKRAWDKERGYLLNSGADLDLSIFDEVESVDQEKIRATALAASRKRATHKLTEEQMDCPGMVNEMTDYILRTAIIPNRTLAFAASLSFQAFLCSRKVYSNRNCTSLYIVALAGSGRGKDRPKEVIRKLVVAAKMERQLLGSLRTYAGLDEAIKSEPNVIATWDEFHRFLRGVVKDQTLESINLMDCMTELFSESRSLHITRLLVGQERQIVYNPSLNLFATSIPKAFYESLGEYAAENGFFYRLLVFDADSDSTERQRVPDEPLPDSLVERALYWKDLQAVPGNLVGVLPQGAPPMIVVPWDAAALAAEQMEAKHLDGAIGIAREVFSRTNEIAIRLATVRACSANHKEPRVGIKDYEWAFDIAKHVADGMMYSLGNRARNTHDVVCDKILDAIKDSGGSMSYRDLARKVRVDTKSLAHHLATLTAREHIRSTGTAGGRSDNDRLTYHLTGE